MSVRAYLGLQPTDDPTHWQLELTPAVLTPSGAMHGGAALAAAVEVLEGTTGRPLVWATAHYLTHAGPHGVLDVDVSVEVAGHQTTQARAVVALGGNEVLLAVASLGARASERHERWGSPPDVPAADGIAHRMQSPPGTQSVLDHYEVRVATGRTGAALDGTPGPGRSAVWCRLPDGPRDVAAGDIALVGDMLMLGLADALGEHVTANSLDNTVRVVERAATEWVLLDVRIDAVDRGYAHAGAHLWTEDGVLLGMATQTLVVRATDAAGQSTRSTRRIVSGD
jgi:acyl-CoA thioesterase